MKRIAVLVVLFFCVIYLNAQHTGNVILGKWKDTDNTAIFEVYRTDNTYAVKIIALSKEREQGIKVLDKKNPDAGLRNRQVVGIIILSGLKYEKECWRGSKIYSPERGIYADCVIRMPDEHTMLLQVSKGIFSTTKTWIKL
ncbi:MAG: DUF2147 domain-containing protein [Bacteroidota bacterium]|nr:DUF2147 domain-containing protein [Bacteroidota bacterium]